MKVLILSVTAGYGHHATGRAVSDELEARGATVRTLDLFEHISKTLYRTVDKGYEFSTKHMQKSYGDAYRRLEARQGYRRRAASTLVADILATFFRRYYNEFEPDVVVCTHVFAALVMNELKLRPASGAVTYGIVTDYTFHPFWDGASRLEYIVTGSELLRHRAAEKGIAPRRLLPFGIPIHPKFSKRRDAAEARRALGLDPERFTILYMSGSMGFGNILDVMQRLDNLAGDIQILCVCGRNEKAKKQVDAMILKKPAKIFGFVDNVDELMDACDCVITKPGGLTTTECLAKGLPMVLVNPIPGQEHRNIDFFLNNGAAMRCNRDFHVDEAVYYLYHNKARLGQMREALAAIARPNATRDLCDHIMAQAKA